MIKDTVLSTGILLVISIFTRPVTYRRSITERDSQQCRGRQCRCRPMLPVDPIFMA